MSLQTSNRPRIKGRSTERKAGDRADAPVAGVSRKGFYRFDPGRVSEDHGMDLRDAVQRIALEMPSYGRLRTTAELKRRGWAVNHKRVQRILREDNLLCLRKRKFVAATTNSRHDFRVYPGLVYHSDRGVQHACDEYTGLLREHGIPISMSRKANPYDNAQTESFLKALKHEEVFRQEYRDLTEAGKSLRRFIEQVYNRKRLHSALGYGPPAEFEQELARVAQLSAAGAA